ncbi:MAG: acyl-CoA thioesterase [Deltaproteobacteria bacterium]|nr:MAG: acyl-CoA thioesterase [Deltaproteobacteria bacterium]
MFSRIFNPGFADTDALGHINNTVFPYWFENARIEIFKLFTPDLDPKKWSLILAKIEVDFKAQCYYGTEVEVKTFIEKVGNSSFVVLQEVIQNEILVAVGRSTMVHFDHDSQKSEHLPPVIKEKLLNHLKK